MPTMARTSSRRNPGTSSSSCVGFIGSRRFERSDYIVVNGVKNVFVESTLGSPSTKRILMGTSPFFMKSPVTCLTVHTDPQDCSLHYTPNSGYYGSILSREQKIASASTDTLINT